MAVEDFGGVLVEGCLRAGILVKEVDEVLKIFKEIWVCQMAAFDVL